MDGFNEQTPATADSATFVLPRRGWLKLHEHRGRSLVLLLAGIVATAAGLLGAVRRVDEFQRLDFRTLREAEGYLVVSVGLRSGAARAGLAPGDVIVGLDGAPAATIDDLEHSLYARRVSTLSVRREGRVRDLAYYPPVPQVDVRYLLVAFAAMFTLAVAAVVYLGHPTPQAGRFLALAEALFAAVVVPIPHDSSASWQLLLLIRDFGRLALPPLLVVFFASFPARIKRFSWLWAAFIPSFAVAALRTGLATGLVPPVVGDVLVADELDGATAVLAVLGVLAAAALSVRTYVSNRSDPTRRRQVEWVALGAAAGFAPYLLLSLIPQWAGAELEVLTWISLLPLALVPLGVASSLLEFRLWDLEDISRQVVATGVAVLLGGVSFAFLNYAITQFGFRLGNWRNLVAVAGGVLLATLTVPARRLLLEGFERLQYRERLAARRALTTFAEEAVAHRDPETLLLRLAQLLRDALAVDKVVTYLALGGRLYPSGASEHWPVLSSEGLHDPFPTPAEAELAERGLWHRFPIERDGRVIGLENTLLMANLRRQVEEHRLLEDYLERIFQFSAAALLICDASGRVLRANERAGTLLRREPRLLVGEFLHALVELRPEWRSLLPTDLAGVQVRFTTAGEWHTGLLSTSALEVEPGRFDGRVVALDDITEQLNLEQRLAEQERLASLGRLAAGLAHEVNTPVTGISSYAQLLRELTPPSDPRAPLAAKLEEQAFRVSRIVTNLLELARPSGFERQLVDLSVLARDEVNQMKVEAERGGVTIEIQPTDDAAANVNRVQFELVVHNLLRNAIQATGAGGAVQMLVGRNGATVWFEVRDTGPGVPEELRERIFEPFVTTREGRGGTGLGLAITRDIVVAHGGTIRALPSEAGGTAMRVEVPAHGRNA
jgi:two-component system NtrC family sensor kinase